MPTVLEINRELADKLYDEAQKNPQSPYAGKKVGIADGKVVVVADDWDDVARTLENAEPDAMKTSCIDMAADYRTVQYIWGIR
jgi:hypothetical protein